MVGPARKREAVKHVQDCLETSERRACAGLGQPRSTQRYQGRRRSADAGLIQAMRRIAQREPRAGEVARGNGARGIVRKRSMLWAGNPKQRHEKQETNPQ
jgi:hypothetical protein